MVTGYLHPGYAESLSEFGTPQELPRCGGWILERQIPGFPYRDAMGCYPLFACQDWSQLHADLADLGNELISLSLVADPFGEYDLAYLQRCFDLVIPFKEHFVADLSFPINDIVRRKWRQYARKAQRQGICVERCQEPKQFLDEWVHLYSLLIDKHRITGYRAFSRRSFAQQLSVPGMVMFRARVERDVVGALLWYVQEKVAYAHLTACNPLGYKLKASYALYWSSIEHFAGECRWLDLGGRAGVQSRDTDGLSHFKRGWSTGTRTAYFCGRIFDRERYLEIAKAKGITNTGYFPAYREGELG